MSALVDQLATQLMRNRKKLDDISDHQNRQLRLVKEEISVENKNKALQGECQKLITMHDTLMEKNKELNEKLQAKQNETDAERAKIQEEMKQMMDKVSADVEIVNKEFEAATIESSNLQHQLETLAVTIENGESKLDGIMNQGQEERAALIEKGEAAQKESEELVKKLEELEEPINKARAEHDELRSRVNVLVKESDALQKQITEVSETLLTQRREHESLTSKEKKLDNEIQLQEHKSLLNMRILAYHYYHEPQSYP